MPAGSAEAELREQGSRFFAFLAPAASREAALAFVEELRRRHPDATHHCFAWRLGWPPAERASDAGEPAGTAGQPILRQLAGANLTDVVGVVVRWFGGTKLGKGGLARAYGGATAAALERLVTREELPARELRLTLPYEQIGAVKKSYGIYAEKAPLEAGGHAGHEGYTMKHTSSVLLFDRSGKLSGLIAATDSDDAALAKLKAVTA